MYTNLSKSGISNLGNVSGIAFRNNHAPELQNFSNAIKEAALVSHFTNCVFHAKDLKKIMLQSNRQVFSIVFSNVLCKAENGEFHSTLVASGLGNNFFLNRPGDEMYFSSEVNQNIKFDGIGEFHLDWIRDVVLPFRKVDWQNEPNGVSLKEWIKQFSKAAVTSVVKSNKDNLNLMRGIMFNTDLIENKIDDLLNNDDNARIALFPVVVKTTVDEDRRLLKMDREEIKFPGELHLAQLEVVTYLMAPINSNNELYYHSPDDKSCMISMAHWPNKWRGNRNPRRFV